MLVGFLLQFSLHFSLLASSGFDEWICASSILSPSICEMKEKHFSSLFLASPFKSKGFSELFSFHPRARLSPMIRRAAIHTHHKIEEAVIGSAAEWRANLNFNPTKSHSIFSSLFF
jgi:hypothetical protein